MHASSLTISFALLSVVSLPSAAFAQCNSYCAVGAFGTGGSSSAGQAQGFHYVVPGRVEGSTVTNSGNFDAGRAVIDSFGNVIGTISGTFRDGICRGLITGVEGDSRGLNPDCF